MIDERQNHIAEKQQPFTLAGVGYIGKLMGRNIKLFRKNLPVAVGLIQHMQMQGSFWPSAIRVTLWRIRYF